MRCKWTPKSSRRLHLPGMSLATGPSGSARDGVEVRIVPMLDASLPSQRKSASWPCCECTVPAISGPWRRARRFGLGRPAKVSFPAPNPRAASARLGHKPSFPTRFRFRPEANCERQHSADYLNLTSARPAVAAHARQLAGIPLGKQRRLARWHLRARQQSDACRVHSELLLQARAERGAWRSGTPTSSAASPPPAHPSSDEPDTDHEPGPPNKCAFKFVNEGRPT